MEKEHFEIILEHMQSQFKIFGEGFEGLNARLESFENNVNKRFDRLEGRTERIEIDVRDIKRTVGLLHAIANDHETRLQNVEGKLEDHLTKHS